MTSTSVVITSLRCSVGHRLALKQSPRCELTRQKRVHPLVSIRKMSFIAFCTLTLVTSAACSNSSIHNRHADISRIFSVK